MNIWSFLLQTLTVSLVALFLLFIKYLFADKLSPRWQYAVWSLLALRILIPVSADRVILIPFAAAVTTFKNTVELHLNSAYSAAFGSASFSFTKPQSVTDLLFIVYLAGVAATLLYYAVGYIRLRVIIRRGIPVSVCDKCRAVVLDGIPSAFVCGFIRPVLVLPSEQVDEKILTHELMHLKHRDALQNAFWCFLRALHWCNPFMHCVFNRIGNDMEALCDSRVLETLDGEELRDYGRILLSMANDRYARAIGTTSISNGGKNISRRIEAIVRFKKYPRGISFASVCIVAVLAFPLLVGTAMSDSPRNIWTPDTQERLVRSLSYADSYRPTTVAGAVDMYAKSVRYGNGILRYAVTPKVEREAFAQQLISNGNYEIDDIEFVIYSEYKIYNARKTDDGYKAVIGFETDIDEFVFVPVLVTRSDGVYSVVKTDGSLKTVNKTMDGKPIPVLSESSKTTPYGNYNYTVWTEHVLSDELSDYDWSGILSLSNTVFQNTIPQPDAEFASNYAYSELEFVLSDTAPSKPVNRIGILASRRGGQITSTNGITAEWDGVFWDYDYIDITPFEPIDDEFYTYSLLIDGHDSPVETVILKD